MSTKSLRNAALAALFVGLGCTGTASAGGDHDRHGRGENECPVGLLHGLTLDEEFGGGTQDLTRCLERRHKVKVVIQINKFCRDSVADADCNRPYALGNITNMLNDYETTHGMKPGKDFEVVAIVHSGGGGLVLQNGYKFEDILDKDGNPGKGWVTISNQFQGLVEELMGRGVQFFFCQNTTRGYMNAGKLPSNQQGEGSATAAMIPGVEYTTAGVTAIADYESKGYSYVQP